MPSYTSLRPIIITTALLLLASLTPVIRAADTLAFPGAQGEAATTPGGRGGKVVRVTTLEASGPGSFAEAIRAKGPRIIVFEVGGVIDLKGKTLTIAEPFVTIAGQTAPSPGITLIRGGLVVDTHDVVMRHLRVRPGEMGRPKKSGWNADGITTWKAHHVIFDHLSCTWATDENLSASGPRFEGATPDAWRQATSRAITISHCLIAECLSNSTHTKGEHSKGTLIHDNTSAICLVGNLYASNLERNPLAKGGAQAVLVNNWISNPGRNAVHVALAKDEWKGQPWQPASLTLVGNVLEHGPDTQKYVALLTRFEKTPLYLFMEDNLATFADGTPAPLTRGEGITLAAQRLYWPSHLRAPLPASEVKAHVAKNAGARPWDRDPIDKRIIDTALAGQGKIIDSEQLAGGYPDPTTPATKQPFREEEWNLETMEKKQ